MNEDTNKRIGSGSKILMLLVALVVDLIEFVITLVAGLFSFGFLAGAAGVATTLVSWGIFFPWFWAKGVKFTDSKMQRNSFAVWGSVDMLLSFIGADAFLPEFTWLIYRNIKAAEKEDEKRNQEAQEKKRGRNQQKREQLQKRLGRKQSSTANVGNEIHKKAA